MGLNPAEFGDHRNKWVRQWLGRVHKNYKIEFRLGRMYRFILTVLAAANFASAGLK